MILFFFFQAEDGIRDLVRSRGLGDVYKRQTQFSANSNGLMRLGSTVVSTNAINQLTTNSDFPKISPYWDDLNTGTVGYCGMKLIGVAPNRKLSVEWILSIPKNSVNTGKFQVWLYEATNVIQYVYNTCLLYTSDAADERSSVDLGGRRIINKKKYIKISERAVISKNTHIKTRQKKRTQA